MLFFTSLVYRFFICQFKNDSCLSIMILFRYCHLVTKLKCMYPESLEIGTLK